MKKYRVLWLLNHTTLRKFEVQQFREIGIDEIFCPKSFPYNEGNLSASVDFSLDDNLTIPPQFLEVLNKQNWYEKVSDDAWDIANEYFDFLFVAYFPYQLGEALRNFKGTVILRAFGLAGGDESKYSKGLYLIGEEEIVRNIRNKGNKFWFGAGYSHLKDIEYSFLKNRNVYLPIGLPVKDSSKNWIGNKKKILFVCPRIGSFKYFENVYHNFIENFKEFDYSIGGAQPIKVNDPKVLGFVTRDEHDLNMREHVVMFYHSQEPNHIHYHPFEAIAAGMPLVFMAGGLLDRLGGIDLPGRAENIVDAKNKIRKIINGDAKFIEKIKNTQNRLLKSIEATELSPFWRDGMLKIITQHNSNNALKNSKWSLCKKKIALINPNSNNKVGSRFSELIVTAIDKEALSLDSVEFVYFSENDDIKLSNIKKRKFKWGNVDANAAERAMIFAGFDNWTATSSSYFILDDEIQQLHDCSVLVFLSPEVPGPILPIKTIFSLTDGFPERYSDKKRKSKYDRSLDFVNKSQLIFSFNDKAAMDCIQYAGARKDKINNISLELIKETCDINHSLKNSFVVVLNKCVSRNDIKLVSKLIKECKFPASKTECVVVVNDEKIFKYLAGDIISSFRENKVKILSDLDPLENKKIMQDSKFIWIPAFDSFSIFSVREAILYGNKTIVDNNPSIFDIVSGSPTKVYLRSINNDFNEIKSIINDLADTCSHENLSLSFDKFVKKLFSEIFRFV